MKDKVYIATCKHELEDSIIETLLRGVEVRTAPSLSDAQIPLSLGCAEAPLPRMYSNASLSDVFLLMSERMSSASNRSFGVWRT